MKRFNAPAASLALLVAACGSSAGVEAHDAWSRPVPPVSPASAIYLEVSNGNNDTVTLTGAESTACAEIELHETGLDEAGVMSMRPLLGGVGIAPGATATLAPGGVHLMCISPDTALATFDITLRIRDAEDVVVPVVVEDR